MTALSPFLKIMASGIAFDFRNPQPDMIDIADIAHHLARESRWGGNVELTFSIAQHSLVVAAAIPEPAWRIYGLLHDAAEAYTGDLITPYKNFLALDLGADVHGHERRILNCIWQRFGLVPPAGAAAEAVDMADARALATEDRDVVKGHSSLLKPAAPPLRAVIRPMMTLDAEAAFLDRFHAYMEMAKQ